MKFKNSLFLSPTTMLRCKRQRKNEGRHKKRQRKDNPNEKDMISDLADSLLLHILSFLKTKEAVQTCILSKRWINLWKTLSTITLDCDDFDDCFHEFLPQILSLRDDSTAICALRLNNCHPFRVNLFRKTIKYAVSHNVKHLQLNVSTIEDFPSCFFSCLTLTSLCLTADNRTFYHFAESQIFPNSLNLPALTTLSLKYFAFGRNDDGCVEPFSAFNMLNTLIVHNCVVLDGQNLRISSTKLVNLSIHMYVDNPNRKIPGSAFGIELYYAPSLHALTLTGHQNIHLFGSKIVLASIKHLNIEVEFLCGLGRRYLSILLNWLVELANIESLTTTSFTLRVFSSFPHLLKSMPPSFWNLKLLKIKTHLLLPGEYSIPEGLQHFFFRNSPSAKVDIIPY